MKLILTLLSLLAVAIGPAALAAQFELPRPFGSTQFGTFVKVLPNGNIVVADPEAFDVAAANSGAVHLYRPDGSLISTLRGNLDNDRIGSGGIVVLPNGNFLVLSPQWEGPQQAFDAGAVTWVDGTRGLDGYVSAENSLVGRSREDFVGEGVTVLPNGNYVVAAPNWDSGSIVNAGAAVFGNGQSGTRGTIGAHNALVGSSAEDRYGEVVYVLGSGDYVVCASEWNNGALANAGAATFASGTHGRSGVVSAQNSLVGGSAGDRVCLDGVAGAIDPTLPNQASTSSRYLVKSSFWNNGSAARAGAVTAGAGPMGVSGVLSAANSIVGSSTDDKVGGRIQFVLASGTVMVAAPDWDRAGPVPVLDAGAVIVGPAGTVGALSPGTALVGSANGDRVGTSLVALNSGNAIVGSPSWRNGNAERAGAATFVPAAGRTGAVSAANSLVGSSVNDQVGSRILVLGNGNYVIGAPEFDRGPVVDAGAAVFASGFTGISGTITVANALLGARANDRVGQSLRQVGQSNYLVISPGFSAAGVPATGAVTFASGASGIAGEVTLANSLFGASPQDGADLAAIRLDNGNYAVRAPYWDRPLSGSLITDAGAIVLGSGSSGVTGVISAQNALVGGSANDLIGESLARLPDGGLVVLSPSWDLGPVVDVGAATWVGPNGLTGPVSAANSLIGSRAFDRVGHTARSARDAVATLVISPDHDLVGSADAGALTRMVAGMSGAVSTGNSLVGATNDRLGSGGGESLPTGFFAIASTVGAGSVSLLRNDGLSVGVVSPATTVFGTPMSPNGPMRWSFDAERAQLVVSEGDANKVTLLRPGIATATLLNAAPLPSQPGQMVTLRASVSTASQAPNQGRVVFRSSDGQTCTDNTPTQVSSAVSEFSCQLSFPRLGRREISAEYLGSLAFAYSAARIDHTTGEGVLMIDGFE